MIIMIVFLMLTLVLIIGTAIYLDYKKKGANNIPKVNSEEQIQNSKKTKKQLADILEIKIVGNIIRLGNRYSSIIELGNVDYNMLSETEQESIENILIQTALSIDYPIQFFSTTEFIDTSKIISIIKENEPKNQNIKDYQNALINYLENLSNNRSISIIKNYAIISYDGNLKNAEDELNRKILSLKNSLLRAKISCNVLNDNELYNLIYRELNKNSSLKINNEMKGGNLYVGKQSKK